MGVGSRKDVKKLLKKKQVTVNGQVVKKSDLQIDPIHDRVTCKGEEIDYQEYTYLMLHKPKGTISATEDNNHKTVIDLLEKKDKILSPFPVGRLDKDTEGLLLLTNDGQLAHELLSPKKNIEKTYLVEVERPLTPDSIDSFAKGITLDDGYQTKPAQLFILEERSAKVIITEGKYHQIKRMFKAIGNQVVHLKRLSMGSLKLDKSLKKGAYRELTSEEMEQLKAK